MAYTVALPNGQTVEVPDDVSPDQAYAEIQKYWEEMNRPPAEGGFIPAVKAGASRMYEGLAALAGAQGVIGEDTAKQQMAEQEAYQKQTFAPTQEGWTEAPWTKLKEAVGGSAAYLPAIAAAGAVGSTVARVVPHPLAKIVGGAVAAGAAIVAGSPVYTGGDVLRQTEEGTALKDVDLTKAWSAGVAQSALDRIGLGMIPGLRRILGQAGKEVTEETAQSIAKQSLAKAAADYAASTGRAIPAEALTETAQQVLERWQAGLNLTDEKARDEYWESLISGGAVAGALAPAGRFFERGGEKAQAEQLLVQKQMREQQEAAAQAATEEASKDTPEYAKQVSDEYLGLEDQIKQLRSQLIKEDETSATATADKLHNESLNKQIEALQPKLKELAAEYNRIKNLPKPEPVEAAAPQFIPEDISATLQNPLGNFKQSDVGPEIWSAVNRYRKDQGKPLLKEYSIEDIQGSMPGVNPKAEQGMIDTLIAARTGFKGDVKYTPEMVLQAAKTAGVDTTTKGFTDFLRRSTGTSELGEMSQPQLHHAVEVLAALPESETSSILPEGTNATHFSDQQYENFLKVFKLSDPMKARDEGLMIGEIKDATGLTSDQDAALFLEEAVKRGDIDQQKRTVYRAIDPKTNKPVFTSSDEAKTRQAAEKRGLDFQAEDVNDYVLGKAPVERTDFGIEQSYAKDGQAPAGFHVIDGDKVLHTAKTEAEAKSRAKQIEGVRSGKAKSIAESIKKIEASIKNADATLVRMESAGKTGTPEYTAAKVKVDAFKRKQQEAIQSLLEEAKGHIAPLSVKPAASKATGKPVFKVTEKGIEGEFATQKEAEEHILSKASNERVAELAAKGHPLTSKRAQSELRRRSAEANKRVEQESKAAEEQKAQDKLDEAVIQDLEKRLNPLLQKFGMGDVALKISKAMRGGGVEAEYLNKVITLAIDVANPVRTMRHETLHALHDLGFFTEGQWKMLKNMADKVWIDKYLKQRAPNGEALQPGQVSRFERYQQLYGADNIEALREEAIADAFGDFDVNGAPKGVFSTLLQKLRDFFEALHNAFTGAGYGTAEGVFRKVEAGELKATKQGGGTPSQAGKPSVANAFKATKAEDDQAAKYEEANGILPYTSQGYLDVPVKYSIKGFNPKKDYGTHPLTGQPLNKDGTMTVYYHTTKAKALEIGNKKFIPADGKRRIYLTNESSGAEILRDKGNFDHDLDGSTVLINIDPDMLQIDKQYDNGRMDFFIPTAQGNAFFKKMQMQSIQKSRQEAITDKFSYEDHEQRISAAVKAFKALTGKQRAAALKKARNVLKQQHNVTSLMTENGKLEKTRTGEYQSGLTVESNIASMGLGLASAQKITDKANTCPRSAICEGLCLGETSGGNFMFGGAASEDVGDINKSSFRAAARMMQYLKTEALIMHPEEFATVLQAEIDAHTKWCEKETQTKKNAETGKRETIAKEQYDPAFRLNVTSDFKPEMFRGIIEGNPGAMFYDYTKLGSEPIAKNHHLTYSSTGFGQIVDGEKVFFKNKAGQYDHNWATMRKRLDNGQNVAMAFSSKSAMPKFLIDEETGVKYAVLNGDDYDARFLDEKTKLKKQQKGRGVIVGLKNKAGNLSEKNSTKKTGGFFVNYDPKVDGDTVIVPDQAQFKQKTIPIAKASLRSAHDTPEFKRWFGDSKVVDENGKPLVVYHGTGFDFDVFEGARKGTEKAYFFSQDPELASSFATTSAGAYDGSASVMPVYLSMKNPLVIDYKGGVKWGNDRLMKQMLDQVWSGKHDGVIAHNVIDGHGDPTTIFAVVEPTQIKSAVGNSGEYSRTNPDIRASLRDIPEGVNKDDWARHLDNMAELEKSKKYSLTGPKRDVEAEINSLPGGAQINQNIANNTYARRDKGFVERLLGALAGDTFSKLRQQAIHRYNRLGEYERRLAAQNGGIERLADQNAEAAALMSDLSASVATASFGFGRNRGGVPVYKNGHTTIDTSKKGLLEVLHPLAAIGDPKIYQVFQHYMAIIRGNRLNNEGKPTQYGNISMAEAQALEQQYPEFKQVRQDWIEYNNGIVDYLVSTGVLSRDKADLFQQHADYVPFYRQMDDEALGPQMFSSVTGLKRLPALKGGDKMLGDFLETVIRNSQAAINMGMKNVAGQRAVKLAEQLGEAHRVHGTPSSTKNVVTVMEGGQKVMYECSDQLFIDAVKSLNMAELPFLEILSAPANLLRSMVTKDPGFILANMLRDSVDAYIRTGAKMTPVVDTLGNFAKNVRKMDPLMEKLYNAGILGGYEASGAVQQTAKNASKELRKKAGTRTAGETLASPFTGLWQQLENLTEASDAATRIAIYKDTLKRTGNEAEALYQALELMNFHRKGSSPVMRIATAAIPFLNARLQGLDNLFRTGIRPLYDKNATTRQKQLQKTMMIRGLTLLGLSTMYAMAVTGDPEYEKQEDETRDNNWIIPFGDTHIKVPIPFEIGLLFKTVPERAYRYYLGKDTPEDTWDSAMRGVRSTFAFNPMPQAFNPMYEVQTNYSQYTRRPIISAGMEHIDSKYQYDANTPAMFRAIGEATGLSPKKMEHLWQGYTGTMGTYGVQLMDSVFDGMGMPVQASKRFEQMPFIKRFVADPEARGQVTAFYDLKNRVDEVVRTVNLLQKEGSPELGSYMEKNATLYASRHIVSSINQQMTNLNGYAKQIRASDMKADEKRDMLLEITKAQNNLANDIRMIRKIVMEPGGGQYAGAGASGKF